MKESNARTRFIEQAILAQEEERARISRELHDGIGQTLTSLLVGLRSLESSLPADDHARALAGRLRETAANAIDEVRGLAHGLRPTALDDLGLGPAIERLTDDVSSRHGFSIDLQVAGLDRGHRLPAAVEITVYRIVQEALNNIAKHAAATQASVILDRQAARFRVIVEDDGRGMHDMESSRGVGLQGIRERLALFGGELTIESGSGGTALFASLPLDDVMPLRFWLRSRGTEIPLPPGGYFIGRSAACEIQLEQPRVSRRHAHLVIGERDASVEDLGSTNGVFVNGRRVEGSTSVRGGDELAVGSETLQLRSALRSDGPDSARFWAAEKTLPGRAPIAVPARREVTERADVLDLVGPLAVRLMETGQVADAERMLSGHLRQVMDAARAGERARESVVEASVSLAVRLAKAARQGTWLDYVFELLQRTGNAPTATVMDTIEALAVEEIEASPEVVQKCASGLKSQSGATPAAREAIARLCRLAERRR